MKNALILVSDMTLAKSIEATKIHTASSDFMLVDIDKEWCATILTTDALTDNKEMHQNFDMIELDVEPNRLSDNTIRSLITKVNSVEIVRETFLPYATVRLYNDAIEYGGRLFKINPATLVDDVQDMLDGTFERGYLEEI